MKARLRTAVKIRVGLSSACIALSVLIAWQLKTPVSGRDSATVIEATAGALPPLSGSVYSLPPLHAYAGLVDRPLFNETRRRPDVVPPRQSEQQRARPDWLLIGTVITSAKGSALLWSPRTNQFLHLERGMTEDGWQLADVTRNTVVIESGKARHELAMTGE